MRALVNILSAWTLLFVSLMVIWFVYRFIVAIRDKELVSYPAEVKDSVSSLFNIGSDISKHPRRLRAILMSSIIAITLAGTICLVLQCLPEYSTQLGGPFENGDYTAYYYVNISNDDKPNTFYRVPARIYSTLSYEGNRRIYILQEVYWSNGGRSTFFNGESRGIDLVEGGYSTDDEDREWRVELTTKRAEKP